MTAITKRCLIIAPQWIGDAVMTEPLLRRLHARGEQITVAAVPWVAPVYLAMPCVREVIELPFPRLKVQLKKRWQFAQKLRSRFDVAYVLPNSFKSALLPAMAGIKQRIGYVGEMRLGLLTHRFKNPSKKNRPAMVDHYTALSGEASIEGDTPELHINSAAVVATLATWNLHPGRDYVFAPGAEFGPAKRWPAAHFAQLAQSLDLPVLLLGSGKEAALCKEINAAADTVRPDACLNLAGKTSLEQALHIIAGAKAVVSNDSGLMHVAAALGVPQVAIFGSSSPLHTPPLNKAAHVLWLKTDASYAPPLDCAPCFARECRFPEGGGHLRCLRDISPERVAGILSNL